jgi:trehalose 6-phosphate phosphatase
MAPVMECDEGEDIASIELRSGEAQLDQFLRSVALAPESALLLDFDGTLAPFRVDPLRVRPWAGVPELLDRIQTAGRTRLALISGRPTREIAMLLGMQRTPEVWGLHGAERLLPDGRLEVQELPQRWRQALAAARAALDGSGLPGALGLRVEEKVNAVVVHWRGKSAQSAQVARERIVGVLQPIAEEGALEMMLFDGGVEVRCGRDKGDAVRLLLAELGPDAPVAYLGDDATDEHAFEALGRKGMSVLVRRAWRPTAAHAWLRPPGQLREFLSRWLAAVRD